MKRVALYVRVSTREQAEEGYSVAAQLDRLKLYCKAKDWLIAGEFVDAGFSGSNLDRPEMQRLIAEAFKGRIDMVLVYKLDRLSRSQKDTLYLIEEVFKVNGVDFSSIQENFDTSTPLGMAMVGILSVFAQLERSQIAERMMMGKGAKVKEGRYMGHARPPIGYDYDAKAGMLIPNEAEAPQVKEIYRMFTEEHKTIRGIQKHMNKLYSTRYGNYSADSTIRKILSNPVYTGRFVYKGVIYDSDHEPIIDDETFDAAKRQLSIRKENTSNLSIAPFSRRTLLSGLIWCGKCGARFGGDTRVFGRGKDEITKKIYCCYTRKKSSKNLRKASSKCKMRYLERSVLEEFVWSELLALKPKSKRGIGKKRAEEMEILLKKTKDIKEHGSMSEQRMFLEELIERIIIGQNSIQIVYKE